MTKTVCPSDSEGIEQAQACEMPQRGRQAEGAEKRRRSSRTRPSPLVESGGQGSRRLYWEDISRGSEARRGSYARGLFCACGK